MDSELNEATKKVIENNKIPILVRILITISLVLGIIGFIYYSTIALYEIYSPNFLSSVPVEAVVLSNVFTYVIINSILNLGIVISMLTLLRKKKLGIYIIITTTMAMILNELTFGNFFGFSYIIPLIIICIILLLYFRRLS